MTTAKKASKKSPARSSKKERSKEIYVSKTKPTKDVATTPPAPPNKAERDPRLPAVGASLDRPYKGKTVTLKFLDDGVEVDGKTFTSLSAAARHVTGAASINGFLWAGLTGTKAAPSPKGAAPNGGKAAKTKASAAPKIGGETNDFATPAGQRAALAAAGVTKSTTGAKSASKKATK